ncbi:MAG: hypothetical protein CSA42_08640, partial [Gammaproteobacteria bacterium]
MKILDALRNATGEIELGIKNSKLFDHNGEIGKFREKIIVDFLRPFLPECYSIGTGLIFDQEDKVSKQIDVVLHDQIFSNVLFKNHDTQLFPFESVYGTIEVKSNLSTEELEKSIKNIVSVKS